MEQSDVSEIVEDCASGLHYRIRRAQGQPIARVLLLHGVGGNEAGMSGLAASMSPEIEVLLVRGPQTLGAGQYAWFQVRFEPNGPVIDATQADQSRQQLIRLLDALHGAGQTQPLPMPTVIGGFSQGGIMSASVGLSAPDRVKGFGVLSGRILPEIEPQCASRESLSAISAFIAHGQFDNKLPVTWADRADRLLTALGVPHVVKLYPIGHELNGNVIADFSQWLHGVIQ